jgi:hypothetical protein
MTQMNRRLVLGLGLGLVGTAPFLARGASAAKPDPLPPRGGFTFADAGRCGSSAFSIANRGRLPIIEAYVRTSVTTGWGADRLGDAVLRAGESKELDPGQGVFDVLLVREDGRTFTAMRQSSCRISEVALNAGGNVEIA